MKKLKKVGLLLSLALMCFGLNTIKNSDNISYASSSVTSQYSYIPSDSAYREDTIYLKQDEKLKREILDNIKEIRSDIWDENVYYASSLEDVGKTRIREIAKRFGYNTKSEYVNAIKWNTELEKYAIQRAYENFLTDGSYYRTDGEDPEEVVINLFGEDSREYNVWLKGDLTGQRAIYMWSIDKYEVLDRKSEYDLLLDLKGGLSDDNKDLHNMLHPSVTQVGFGKVKNSKNGKTYGVMVDGHGLADSQKVTGYVGNYKYYVGDPNVSPLSKDTEGELRSSIKQSEIQLEALENILENYPTTVANVVDKLYDLMDETYYLIRKSYALLGEFENIY